MKTNLTTRIGRILSGSANALVDAVETQAPALVMAQAIREVDAAIEEVRGELGRTAASIHLADKRLSEERERHQSLGEQIATALREQRGDLAEAAIGRQLDIEAQLPVLERTVAEGAERERELQGYIQALQSQRREMNDELKRFTAPQPTPASVAAEASTGAGVAAKVADAEAVFDRVLERATGLPARRGDPGVNGLTTGAQLAELEALNRKHRIQERLAALTGAQGAQRE